MNAGSRQRFHVDDAVQVVHVGGDKVDVMGGISLERFGEAEPSHVLQAAANDFIGAVLYPFGGIGIRGPPLGGLYLKPRHRVV